MSVIGIDLGTTNSCVAIAENGKQVVIPNKEGKNTTPSFVAITSENETLVGEAAKRQAVTNPANTIYAAKRFVGRRASEDVAKNWEGGYHIGQAKNGDVNIEITKDGKKEHWAPEQFLALILQKMKASAEDYLGTEVTEAVITVPAYFNDAQRQATKDAGRIAGLEVKRIINEPTAAALAYGMDKKRGDRKVAVYDLGGGTFDISIIEIADVDGEHQFEVLATNGNTTLGGEDFDGRLMEYLINTFKQEQGFDLNQDKMAVQRLREAAEKAKIELSTAQQTDINLPYITADSSGPKHLNIKVTRAKLESLVEDLIQESLEPCRLALKDSGLSASDIDDVILVGGQTRMPKVQEAVEQLFGKEPRRDVNPDEAVAIGAAIQGGVLSGNVTDILLLDVTPLSLGVETMGGVMTKVIEANTTIPTNASQVFSTAENNQTTVTIHVLQGNRPMAQDNKSLGSFNLTDIPPAPRGAPQIEVTFDIDANGILNVSAVDKATNKKQNIVIKAGGGLSEEEIKRMQQEAEENAEADQAKEKLVTAKNQADTLIHASEKSIKDLGDQVEESEKTAIHSAIDALKKTLESDNVEDIEAKTQALSEVSSKLAERVYQQAQQASDANPEQASSDAQADEGVVDAEFEEVDQDKK